MKDKKIFSPDQLSAIQTRDRTLLVSAAAGSGKTTTLTERIIRSLLDEEHPESLQNMLIVTFTNAAVADLVKKIGEALAEAVRANPDNKRLEGELYLLPSAHIRTIDAFCNEILRANTDKVGVPPNFRIAEEAEVTLLSVSLLDTLISAAYEGALEDEGITPEDFESLAVALTDTRSSRALAEVFRSLYEKSKNAIDGVRIFETLRDNYLTPPDTPIEKTRYGKDLIELTKECVKYCTGLLNSLSASLIGGTDREVADCAAYTAAQMTLARIIADGYTAMRDNILAYEFPSPPRCPADEKTEKMESARAAYNTVKAHIADLKDRFYLYTEDMWHTLLSDMHKTLGTLADFLRVFDRVYTQEKMRRAMLEYSDIERLAYRCLYTEDGKPSEVAEAYKSSLSSIYIDEYQDVNELQDAIFAAMSNGKNRFMVGDIKQSIYVFRSAKPEIFARMKTEYKRLGEVGSEDGATIFMSENYRCDRGIIDFVNTVFDRMFEATRDSIGYVREDRLRFAKKHDGGEGEYIRPDIFIVERPDKESDESSLSPRFVAEKIKELILGGTLADGSPVTPSDIAIILRKRDGIAAYADALSELGIKADRGTDRSFFMNAEVRLTLCLLNSIDNPSRDVYLAGLMCSPLFSFTADDMLRYRLKNKERTLYRSIKKYSEAHPEDEKLSGFLSKLSHYRTLSEGMNVYTLISRLYSETGLMALASVHGGKDNLIMLYNYARKYEQSSYKGLYNFISYVNSIVSIGESIDEKSDTGMSDAVKITTAHSSKGLEYPIVFFAEASRALTNRDLKERIAYSEGYGMAAYLRAPDGLTLAENPLKHIIHERMKEKFYEEELRVLYVALTRARERLFIVGDLPHHTTLDGYLERIEMKASALSSYSVRHFASYLEIILAAKPDAEVHFIGADRDEESATEAVDTPAAEDTSPERNEEVYKLLLDRFSYEYPNPYKTTFPEKMSVSRLYPTVLDGTDEGEISVGAKTSDRVRLPSFISGVREGASAERGIATHLVLQFCDLDRLMKDGGACELSRLVSDKFISKEKAALVRLDEIELFRSSELFARMRGAKRLYRELRFNSRLDAHYFTEDEQRRAALAGEEVLVQGVIDCIIEDEAGDYHLIDYKTDRLTREELADINLAQRKLNEAHSLQLTYYALAIEKVFGKKPKTVSVYSLPLGRCVDISLVPEGH